jgi:hypothetical protein
LKLALQKVIADAAREKDKLTKAAANAVLNRTGAGLDYFRVHPKGRGIVCCEPKGLEPVTFVAEYLGQMHSAHRWFELQYEKRKEEEGSLPDFYNIILERPRDDPCGYDVLFIDAMHMGNFSSRMSHSCDPNCQAVIMSCNGRLTIAVYTLRRIEYGEELTFDYASVTEDQDEFKAATCLCGMDKCRGSFLSFQGGNTLEQYLHHHHTLADRNLLLLKACEEALTEDDWLRIARHGLGLSALGDYRLAFRQWCAESGFDSDGHILPNLEAAELSRAIQGYEALDAPPTPSWLLKWVALTLDFVDREQQELPAVVMASPENLQTEEMVALEVKGLRTVRLQNLVVALDKVLNFFKVESPAAPPPVCTVSEADALELIFNGPKSIVQSFLVAASKRMCPLCDHGGREKAHGTRRQQDHGSHCSVLKELQALGVQQPDMASARSAMYGMADALRCIVEGPDAGAYLAASDILRLWASTESFFRQGPTAADGSHASSAGARVTAEKNPAGRRRFHPNYVSGQLTGWWKQISAHDPVESAARERRGSIQLPDLDSCLPDGGRSVSYLPEMRQALLQALWKQPDQPWAEGSFMTFRSGLCGSPVLDAVLRGEKPSGAQAVVEAVLHG